eukprot:TRINITY_DN6865_c0_g1_i1.p1 TRINITY_DN6865_c0_g1~~TRINITY_DN6865_c0_g1_i1.p1  ORF type:complete len:216 (-),score=35.07 TRINITY_DN6865_c0_g1_i1:5-616(-)
MLTRAVRATMQSGCRSSASVFAVSTMSSVASVSELRARFDKQLLPLSPQAKQALAPFPAQVTIPTRWGDEDMFGHINNCCYVQYAEQSRVTYFALQGAQAGVDFGHTGIGPILASFEIKFIRPVNWPSVLGVGARVSHFSRQHRRFTIEHAMVEADSGDVVAVASGEIAIVDYSKGGVAIALPENLIDAINQLEKKEIELRQS